MGSAMVVLQFRTMLVAHIEIELGPQRLTYRVPLHPRYGPDPRRANALLQYALLSWREPVVVTPGGREVTLRPGRVRRFAVWRTERTLTGCA